MISEKNFIIVLFGVILLIDTSFVYAGESLGPFTADKHTRLLLHFDGTPVKDESGNGMKVEECRGEIVPCGKFGGAIKFSEKSDLLIVPASVFTTDKGTFEVWINFYRYASGAPIYTDYPHIVIFENGYKTTGGSLFTLCQQEIVFYYHPEEMDRVVPFLFPRENIGLERWYHIALCWDKDSSKIYIDGELKAEGTPIKMRSTEHIIIGNLSPKGNAEYYFSGLMDELRISDIVRY